MDKGKGKVPCKECSAKSIEVPADAEHLQQHLEERDNLITALQAELLKSTAKATALDDQILTWREKYERLYDSHKRVQKLNQTLEDKLLRMVDRMKSEKTQLTKDIATLSLRLAESKHSYGVLQKENERYKNDMNLAIQLLQCKPDNFVAQKLDSLSSDTQARVSQYVMSKAKANSQSKNSNENETFDASEYEFNISASLMSKILEDSIHDTVTKHCDTCTCAKAQSKPFCYNDSHYSVSTQTLLSGEMKNSLCLSCNSDLKPLYSCANDGSTSPQRIKLLNEKHCGLNMNHPMYIIPQPTGQLQVDSPVAQDNICSETVDKNKMETVMHDQIITKIGDDLLHMRKNSGMAMEPTVHHKLCDRTKTISSANPSIDGADTVNTKSASIHKRDSDRFNDVGKGSQHSLDCHSRTSSVAKSTTSTHKSNTHVGPGPRFCSLRVQAGSKNILLDNAQPDVPPVLYKRHSKFSDDSILKELNDGMEHLLHTDKNDGSLKEEISNDDAIEESTLIDVRVESNRDVVPSSNKRNMYPVMLNVSSSPLRPQKTHTFSNGSDNNTRCDVECGNAVSDAVQEMEKLLLKTAKTLDNAESTEPSINEVSSPSDGKDVKQFNFDHFEQRRSSKEYARSLRNINKSQLASIRLSLASTKISKEASHQGDFPKVFKKIDGVRVPALSSVVNVYPNLTQTHLKVNDNLKGFTNEHSTSSLSSDDSAVFLQKQQLIRVAEWVKQNHDQQSNFNDQSSVDEDPNYNGGIEKSSTKNNNGAAKIEVALNMPHPVSKFSKSHLKDPESKANTVELATPNDNEQSRSSLSIEKTDNLGNKLGQIYHGNNLESVKSNGDKISKEEMARMEYNVKKFLLSGPMWSMPEKPAEKNRRTSSKTETDV